MADEDWDNWEAADELAAASGAEPSAASPESPPASMTAVPAPTAAAAAAVDTHVLAEHCTAKAPADDDDRHADACETNDDSDPWSWNFERMERDVHTLPRCSADTSLTWNSRSSAESISVTSAATGDAATSEDAALVHILQVAEQVAGNIHAGRARVVTLEALALVSKLHLLALRRGFDHEQQPGEAAQQIPAIVERLQHIAGNWAIAELTDNSEHQLLQETTTLLHHALASSTGDLAPFQQVFEQVFASLPHQTLTVSVAWIRPCEQSANGPVPWDPLTSGDDGDMDVDPRLRDSGYLQHLQHVTDPAAGSDCLVVALTDAEVFQDSKDIRRDELVINGAFISGTLGYAAIVDMLQQQIERVMREQVGQRGADAPAGDSGDDMNAFTATTRAIAKQILNACNRTESGGSSYEILSKFLSNHAMDAVLIRPDSAKAAPLEIRLDVGAFEEASSSSNSTGDTSDGAMWAFGLRAVLSAVTWYLVCDADDPTSELYEIKTTYENRLAFPLGFTPFHPMNSMRKDCGSVRIQLVLPQTALSSSPPVPLAWRRANDHAGAVDQTADFDELL